MVRLIARNGAPRKKSAISLFPRFVVYAKEEGYRTVRPTEQLL